MPFLQPRLTRLPGGNITVGNSIVTSGTDLYVPDTNANTSTVTFTTPAIFDLPDGIAWIKQDTVGNNGFEISRTQELASTFRSYVNCRADDSNGNLLSYGGVAHQDDGTLSGLFTQFYGTDSNLSVYGSMTVAKSINGGNGGVFMAGGTSTNQYYIQCADDAIKLGQSGNPNTLIQTIGSAGSGQVYDSVYNNPNHPTYQSLLGAGYQLATTTGTGSYTPVVSAFAVTAGNYYRISLAGTLYATGVSPTGGMAMMVKFNNTADQIILAEFDADQTADNFTATIEFRVPATNTTMTIGVEGRTKGSPFTVGEVTGGWNTLSIVNLN